ncbi:MAG: control of competence regulator comk ylbf/ymca [Verrucomicrobiaceae bacterium]|nr:control of competence regulator comk ylbf/ymca [Verrucomicrobiaceae bacterium]
MNTLTLPSIEDKIQELCAAIVADDEVQEARKNAEAFLADESAVGVYRQVALAGRELEKKQRQGHELSDEEIESFNQLQEKAETNPAVKEFQTAQETLQDVAELIQAWVTKTLEKGRVPTEEEVFPNGSEGGSCGEGCGCH